jgi:hypothetical protein
MRMGRVLGLVAGGLVACIALLVLAVFLTRDEDNLQADNLLAERFTLEVARGGELDLRRIAPFEWDSVLLVAPGTPRDAISRRLGREWTGIDTVDGGDLLIFRQGAEVVRFADYRGTGRFEGFARPFANLPPVLHAERGVIRP